eukprot:5464965-Amphidinium_carterae.2
MGRCCGKSGSNILSRFGAKRTTFPRVSPFPFGAKCANPPHSSLERLLIPIGIHAHPAPQAFQDKLLEKGFDAFRQLANCAKCASLTRGSDDEKYTAEKYAAIVCCLPSRDQWSAINY